MYRGQPARWSLPAIALAIAGLATSGRASAQPSDEAKILFEQGREAMKAKDFDAACAAFRKSYESSAAKGALLNWADCEEARGRTGTALRLWRIAPPKLTDDPDRLEYVRQRIGALDGNVPTLGVVIETEGVHPIIRIDGLVVDASAPIPIDPGIRKITAEAPGLPIEERTLEVAATGHVTLRLFQKPPAPVAPGPTPPAPSSPSVPNQGGGSGLTTAGWVVGGIGAAGLVTFGITAGMVAGACGLDDGVCPADDESYVTGLNVANLVGLIVGGVGVGTGVVLLVVGGQSDDAPAPARAWVAPVLGPGYAGLRGAF